jgi:hypothetical protein
VRRPDSPRNSTAVGSPFGDTRWRNPPFRGMRPASHASRGTGSSNRSPGCKGTGSVSARQPPRAMCRDRRRSISRRYRAVSVGQPPKKARTRSFSGPAPTFPCPATLAGVGSGYQRTGSSRRRGRGTSPLRSWGPILSWCRGSDGRPSRRERGLPKGGCSRSYRLTRLPGCCRP